MSDTQAPVKPISEVDPTIASTWVQSEDTVLIDVREDHEYAEERIEHAEFHALSTFDGDSLRERHADKRVIFQCRSGRRSLDAAQRYRVDDHERVFNLAGGIEAWKAAGLPVTRPASAPRIPVMRQVQITAGAIVLIGVLLGAFVHPRLLVIPAFIGAGLMFAGVSGWCGMAKLFAGMPWNR